MWIARPPDDPEVGGVSDSVRVRDDMYVIFMLTFCDDKSFPASADIVLAGYNDIEVPDSARQVYVRCVVDDSRIGVPELVGDIKGETGTVTVNEMGMDSGRVCKCRPGSVLDKDRITR